MTTVESVVLEFGNGLDPQDFARELDRVMRDRARSDPRALSAHDRDVLLQVGVPTADLQAGEPRTLVGAAADLLEAQGGMRTVGGTAELLGRSPSRIRGAIADGSLFAVKLGRSWMLPDWQFDGARPLPSLRAVLAAVPEGMSALALGRLLTEPHGELTLDGVPVSPRHWLLAGRPAAPVTDLVSQFYAW
jgi:hypothetical protein